MEEARDAALRLLTVRSRSVAEIRKRLGRKGFDRTVVDRVVEGLARTGLLDDHAFARQWVEERIARRPRGRFALVQELRGKGVDREVAEEAVEAVFRAEGVAEEEIALRAAEKWLARRSRSTRSALVGEEGFEAEQRARRRLYGALVRKGFPRDAVGPVVDRIVEHLEGDPRRGRSDGPGI